MSASPKNVVGIRLMQIGDEQRVKGRAILAQARAQKLDSIMVVGRTDDGELWAASSLNAGQSLYLLEKLKERILQSGPWGIV